jgi:hypothetical protein
MRAVSLSRSRPFSFAVTIASRWLTKGDSRAPSASGRSRSGPGCRWPGPAMPAAAVRSGSATRCTVESATPTSDGIWTGPRRFLVRWCTILRTTGGRVRLGLRCGRDDRSAIPASPNWRYRSVQRVVVVRETWNRSAARATGHCSSTMQRASRSRQSSDNGALVWATRTSEGAGAVRQLHTSLGGPRHIKIIQSTRVHQPPGAEQLAGAARVRVSPCRTMRVH